MGIKYYWVYILGVMLVVGSSNSTAQELVPGFYHKTFTVENGLPVNTITDVELSDDGYVWVSTRDGLIRYEGLVRTGNVPYTIFNMGNTDVFQSNVFSRIYKSSNNEFFVISSEVNGVQRLIHLKDDSMLSYGTEVGFKGQFNALTFDRQNNLWVINDGKIYQLKDGEWTHEYPEIDLLEYRGNFRFQVDSRNSLWVYAGRNHTLIHIEDGKLKIIGKKEGLQSNRIYSFYKGHNDELWVGTADGLKVIREENVISILPIYERADYTSQNILSDPNVPDRIIYRIDNRLYVIYKDQYQDVTKSLSDIDNSKQSEFKLIGPEESGWLPITNKLFFNNRLVFENESNLSNIAIDRVGGIWFTSRGKLHYLKKTLFDAYTEQSHGIRNSYPIIQDHEGNIWISTLFNGVFVYKDDQFINFDSQFDISIKRTFSILEDKDRNMWFGANSGFFFWDRTNPIEAVQLPDGSDFGPLKAIYQDSNNRIWAGGRDGVYFNSNNKWQPLPIFNEEERVDICFIYEDRNGTIWFGSEGLGLLYFDEEKNQLSSFEFNDQLSSLLARSMYQDKKGIYWIGTNGSGLNRIEFIEGQTEPMVTFYSQNDGLLDQTIHTLQEDQQNRLWMSSNNGIFWVPLSKLNEFASGGISEIYSSFYSEIDGLPGIEANGGMQSTAMKDKAGRLWYSMINGIAVIDPNIVSNNSLDMTTLIEKLMTNEHSYSSPLDGTQLSKDERNLQFSYISYNPAVKPDIIKFRYTLDGYEDNWNTVGNRRDAFYTGVKAGDYTFRVQAATYGAEWTDVESTMTLSIDPYFYETVWFKILSGSAFLMFIYVVFQWRLYQAKAREVELTELVNEQTSKLAEQSKKLLELDKAKSKFFTNVTHELRTPLTLILGPLNDLKKNNRALNHENISNKIELAIRHSKRLLRLVNQMLDISKVEVGTVKVKAQKTNLVDFVDQIVLAFTGLAERKNIELNFNSSKRDIPVYIDVDMMDKILINILSNAFKFTSENGTISLEITDTKNSAKLSISDNGVGIDPEDIENIFKRFYQTNESLNNRRPGAGIGLSLVKELVELHQGDIYVDSTINEGSVFTISIKKGKEHFSIDELIPEGDTVGVGVDDMEAYLDLQIQDIGSNGHNHEKKHHPDHKTILIIDDNADIRKYLYEHLSKSYYILEAEDGNEGIKIARSKLPDIIICDVMMPKMNGYEFCKELKSDTETDFIPVILLTAKADQRDKLEGLDIGADDYIVKPFDIEEVISRADNLISIRKKLMDRFKAPPISITPSELVVKSEDELFLENLKQNIEENLVDEMFGVKELAESMAINRVTLHNKLKKLSKQTPSEVIKEFRLQRAHQLLRQNAGNISEIAYSVGFKSISHFSRVFKEKYSITPSQYSAQEMNS